jgi:hypothetical protein
MTQYMFSLFRPRHLLAWHSLPIAGVNAPYYSRSAPDRLPYPLDDGPLRKGMEGTAPYAP